MAKTSKLTAERARELLDYDPETGVLRWKKNKGTGKANAEAGSVCTEVTGKKYRYIKIDGTQFRAHRVVWIIWNGCAPELQIDHIDGNGLNNRISNLRHVTHLENRRNSRRQSNNKSGSSGVDWDKRRCKWRARIKVCGFTRHIGYFVELEEAIAARKEAEATYGFHENHGSERPL